MRQSIWMQSLKKISTLFNLIVSKRYYNPEIDVTKFTSLYNVDGKASRTQELLKRWNQKARYSERHKYQRFHKPRNFSNWQLTVCRGIVLFKWIYVPTYFTCVNRLLAQWRVLACAGLVTLPKWKPEQTFWLSVCEYIC